MADYISTQNACKLCMPLGATVVFKGVKGSIPYLHGSQGCATYMRRYIISHFREPMDIASSSLGEKEAIYGGSANLKLGIQNVVKKYNPEVIGVATTCLTETIGDDLNHILGELEREWCMDVPMPRIVKVSTPSYQGSHMEGFHAAVRALVSQLADEPAYPHAGINILPGFLSPEDLRHLRELCTAFGLGATILPDYSETLDGPAKASYENIQSGGTSLDEISKMGGAVGTLEFGRSLIGTNSAAAHLGTRFKQKTYSLGTPIGLRENDKLFEALRDVSGKVVPRAIELDRGRLIDAYVDGHKYLYGKKAVLYGEEDMVVGLASFLAETGVQPVICATGSKSQTFEESIKYVTRDLVKAEVKAMDGVDFYEIDNMCKELGADILIGNSKGQKIAREMGVPLVRVGFPIHDRFGGQRLLHIGYKGALRLYDEIVNAVLKEKQESTDIGYGYL